MKNLIVFALLWVPLAFAGGGGIETSGGGTGIQIGDKVMLLDLAEAGLLDKIVRPPLQTSVFTSRLEHFNLSPFMDIPLLNTYINLIWQKDPFLADGLIRTILLYQWFLTPLPLKLHPPNTVIDVPLEQIALRKGATIYVEENLFKKMSPEHRVALVLHEAFSALGSPDIPESRSRQIIGRLFSSDFSQMSKPAFADLLGPFYISQAGVRQKLAQKFEKDFSLSRMALYYPMLRTMDRSSISQVSKELGFFPIMTYAFESSQAIQWTLQDAEYQQRYCLEREEPYEIRFQYFTIDVTLPSRNDSYAPFVSWDVKENFLTQISYPKTCSPEFIQRVKGLLDDMNRDFIESL